MKLLFFEQEKVYVKKCLENGEIDYLEAVSERAETEFFGYLNTRGVLNHFANTCPLKRKKQEGSPWLYVGSDITFSLHGM